MSDDGSKLIIDGALVINNDGYHATRAAEGSVPLAAGTHTIDVPYWQGPGRSRSSSRSRARALPSRCSTWIVRSGVPDTGILGASEVRAMAIVSCPECKQEVSDKAPACPHCGFRLASGRFRPWWITLALLSILASGGAALAMVRGADSYSRVDELRAEQDADGTRDEHVRQRFYRLYEEHPRNAMYIYLWARCVDDPAQQLDSAHQGIEADPRFAWNYNMASRALARLNRVPEAYDEAVKGAALDPGNLELTKKTKALKLIIDKKLLD